MWISKEMDLPINALYKVFLNEKIELFLSKSTLTMPNFGLIPHANVYLGEVSCLAGSQWKPKGSTLASKTLRKAWNDCKHKLYIKLNEVAWTTFLYDSICWSFFGNLRMNSSYIKILALRRREIKDHLAWSIGLENEIDHVSRSFIIEIPTKVWRSQTPKVSNS